MVSWGLGGRRKKGNEKKEKEKEKWREAEGRRRSNCGPEAASAA